MSTAAERAAQLLGRASEVLTRARTLRRHAVICLAFSVALTVLGAILASGAL